MPIYFILLFIRLIRKKELISRVNERFGITHYRRPEGALIWLHAASVGESMMALTLIEGLSKIDPSLNFLITSGTVSSSRIIRNKLPDSTIHQFLPIDNIIFVNKFLRHWQPTLGIFIESELWPCVIVQAAKICPLLLLNACLSDRSFKLWLKLHVFFQQLMKNFLAIAAQSDSNWQKFKQLGISTALHLGNIKFANKKLVVDNKEYSSLAKLLSNKKIIVLASTHLADEQVILKVIKPIKEQFPDCYFILAPRHPERKSEISILCEELGLSFSFKTKTSLPLLEDDLYIVDKLGELGVLYDLAYASFIGGSFKQGGHNVLEPAHFGNLIIFGPNMSKTRDIAAAILTNKAAIQIKDEQQLLSALQYFLSHPEQAAIYGANALKFIADNQKILSAYLDLIISSYKNEKFNNSLARAEID